MSSTRGRPSASKQMAKNISGEVSGNVSGEVSGEVSGDQSKTFEVQKKISDTATVEDILNDNIFGFDPLQKTIYYMFYKAMSALLTNMKKSGQTITPENMNTYFLKIAPGVIKQYSTAKKKYGKQLRKGPRCMARKTDCNQCTRQPSGTSQFCKSHQKTLPCGRIDEEVINTPVQNKRGRKRKFKYDPRMNDNDYVTVWEDIVDGTRVFVDFEGNVYSYNENAPVYLGRKTLEGKIDSSWVKPR